MDSRRAFVRFCFVCFFFLCVPLSSSAYAVDDIIVKKNLFSPNRTPPSPVDNEQKVDSSLKLSDLQLDGIIFFSTQKSAVLRVNKRLKGSPGKSSSYSVVREGELIGPYKVVRIYKDRIVVDYNGELHDLLLHRPGKRISPPPPPPPSPVTEDRKESGEDLEMDFPSPDEFKKLSPREKKRLVKKMREMFIKRLERGVLNRSRPENGNGNRE